MCRDTRVPAAAPRPVPGSGCLAPAAPRAASALISLLSEISWCGFHVRRDTYEISGFCFFLEKWNFLFRTLISGLRAQGEERLRGSGPGAGSAIAPLCPRSPGPGAGNSAASGVFRWR